MTRQRKWDKIESEIISGVYADEELADMYEDISDDDWCRMSERAIRRAGRAWEKVRKGRSERDDL